MGNKPKKKNKLANMRRMKQHGKVLNMIRWKNKNTQRINLGPRKLSVLCKMVIKKYKLWPQPTKKITAEPSSCTVVGGKPLRERKKESTESVSSNTSTSSQPRKKQRVNKAGDQLPKKVEGDGKKRGRPRKQHIPGPSELGVVKRGRPRKECFPEISVTMAGVSFEPEIRIKEESGTEADDQDPFAPDDVGYTVIVKEEFEADEETKLLDQSTSTSDPAPIKVMAPILVCSQNVGPSSSSLLSAISTSPPLMTVVADEMQIFGNSIAEQLRKFPLDRALLLQLEIQTMIDNERQLLLH